MTTAAAGHRQCPHKCSYLIVNSNSNPIFFSYVSVNERVLLSAPPWGKPTEGQHPYTRGNDPHPWVYGCGCCAGRGAGRAPDTRGLTPGIPYSCVCPCCGAPSGFSSDFQLTTLVCSLHFADRRCCICACLQTSQSNELHTVHPCRGCKAPLCIGLSSCRYP